VISGIPSSWSSTTKKRFGPPTTLSISVGRRSACGEIVAEGTLCDIERAKFFDWQLSFGTRAYCHPKTTCPAAADGWLTVVGARENNLKKIVSHFLSAA